MSAIIHVHFEGTSLDDIRRQVQEFMGASAAPAVTAETKAPARTRAKAGETKTTLSDMVADAAAKPETQPETDKAVNDLLVKQQADAKEEALAKARDIFAMGPEGQAKVRAVAKEFGKKKLSEVDVTDAFRLRELINDAEQELKAAAKSNPDDAV